jgi:hypothetical protein
VVHGSIQARGAKNIAIRGRGILDVSSFERGQGGGAIRLVDCEKIIIEGIVMRDPDVWCCTLLGCRDATIDNVKLIGLWRYNADGIDICNSQDVVIRNCFVRSFDDSLVLKGLKSARRSFDDRPVQNVCATGCVIWNDWGRALEIGAETCAPSISQVVFEDCDIIRTTHIAMDIQHGDRAVINNVTFRNIRVEIDEENLPPRMQARREEKYQEKATRAYSPKLLEIVIRPTPYSRDDRPGTVRDVLLDNINVRCKLVPPSHLLGFNAENDVRGVKITGLRIGGRSVASLEEARVTVGPHVKNLTIKSVP